MVAWANSHRTAKLLRTFDFDDLAQPVPGSMQTNLGRRHGDAQFLGNGFMGKVIHIAKHNDRSQFFGQTTESFNQFTAQGLVLDNETRIMIAPIVNEVMVVDQYIVAMTMTSTTVRGGTVRCDPVHPRRELRIVAELRQRTVGPDIGVLNNVAGVVCVSGEPQRKGVGVCIGQFDDAVERLPISGLCFEYQRIQFSHAANLLALRPDGGRTKTHEARGCSPRASASHSV